MTARILHGPKINYPINKSLGKFLFDCGNNFGDRICQIDGTTNQQETYASVKQRATRVALELKKRGITSKDVIVFCFPNSLDCLIPIIGSLYLGAKVANLDPSLSIRQTTHLLSLVNPSVIFVEEGSVLLIEESLTKANLNSQIVVLGQSKKYATFADFTKSQLNEEDFVPPTVDINDVAIIFFSSGTTGLPKAICHTHFSFLHVANAFFNSGIKCDVMFSVTSFYWVSASIILFTSFLAGGTRIFCSLFDAELTYKIIEKYRVTLIFLAPILTYKLTNFENWKKYDTSSVHAMLVGGTPISPQQFERVGKIFYHSHILIVYGLSEVGIATIFNPNIEPIYAKTKISSCGNAAPNISIKVVDLDTKNTVTPLSKGEICIKSPSLMKGYYKQDSDVFDEDGFLHTGDVGFYDEEECIYVIERIKEMFKYTSWHVVPSVIEAVLLEHPAICEAVVFGVPENDEVGELPTACVILKENSIVSKEEIEKFVATRVADYEKLRGGVFFVQNLMKTPSGKLMRKEIRNAFINSITK